MRVLDMSLMLDASHFAIVVVVARLLGGAEMICWVGVVGASLLQVLDMSLMLDASHFAFVVVVVWAGDDGQFVVGCWLACVEVVVGGEVVGDGGG